VGAIPDEDGEVRMVNPLSNPRYRAVAVVTALGFLVVLGSNAVTPVLALTAAQMGASKAAIGIMFGSLYAVRFVIGPAVGTLSDRRGLRWTLRVCLLVGPAVPLIYRYAPNFTFLIGGRLLSGVVSSAFSPIVMGYLGMIVVRGTEGTVTGLYNAAYWAAVSLGTVASGIVADHWGLDASYTLFLGASVMAAVLVFLLPNERTLASRDSESEESPAKENAARRSLLMTCLTTPLIVGLLVANFSLYVNSATLAAFFPLFGAARSYSITQIGIFMSILGGVGAVLQFVFGRLSDRIGPPWLLLVGGLTLSLGVVLLLAVTPFAAAVIAAAILAVGVAAMQASLTTSSVVVGRQLGIGEFMGIFYSAQALGNMLGPALSGVAAQFGSYSIVFGPPAALALIAALVNRIIRMRRQSSGGGL
jgi:MFS transporter, DHA1 family, multidrug resistance protein